jgi:D-glycero-D-manno-heptose 1,7-bisphosphate phosphatase
MTQTGPTGRACVFLDRDGTLNEDVGYAHRPDQLVLLPGVVQGLTALRRAGLLLVVVTNQSGVARGYYTEDAVVRFHRHLDQTLGADAAPDAYYYCPYHPEGTVPAYRLDSPLRKPGIGMFERARAELFIDPQRSFMVGDTAGDMQFAARAGLRAILLSSEPSEAASAYLVRSSFAEATEAILALLVGGADAWA